MLCQTASSSWIQDVEMSNHGTAQRTPMAHVNQDQKEYSTQSSNNDSGK